MASPTPPPLLSIRATLILVVGLVAGLVIGGLTAAAGQPMALAIAVGLSAAGATIVGLHKLIDAN